MNRMVKWFADNKAAGKGSVALYFPLGDTVLGDDAAWAKKYFENGCDVLEVGLPCTNPCLDGPTISESMARARGNINHERCFEIMKEIRRQNPDRVIQFITYYENVAKYGAADFARICHECGIDGVLAPDASVEQSQELYRELKKYDICCIRFAPYTLNDEIIEDMKNYSSGYIFQQAVNGGTGMRDTVDAKIRENIAALAAGGIKTPLFAGFGINSPEQAKEVLSMGPEGIIIGSATVSHLIKGDCEEFIKSISDAIH